MNDSNNSFTILCGRLLQFLKILKLYKEIISVKQLDPDQPDALCGLF